LHPVFDSAFLSESAIASLTDNSSANFRGIHAHAIVAMVSNIRIRFFNGLNVCANSAVIQKIDRSGQDASNYLFSARAFGLDAKKSLYLPTEFDRSGGTIKYATAFADR
jgi:hypothetical protein